MKTIFCIIISVLISLMSGCSNADSESVIPDVESDMSNVVSESEMFDIEFSDMPDIVFEVSKVNEYERGFDEDDFTGQGRCSLTFVDKNGNYYFSDYSEIYFLSNEELIESLKSGDERITKLPKSCDTEELLENYKKLLKVANNKEYELEYPEVVPGVDYDHITWDGLYYDKDGNLSSLLIHEHTEVEIYANDDRANEIYEWFSGAVKHNKNLK